MRRKTKGKNLRISPVDIRRLAAASLMQYFEQQDWKMIAFPENSITEINKKHSK